MDAPDHRAKRIAQNQTTGAELCTGILHRRRDRRLRRRGRAGTRPTVQSRASFSRLRPKSSLPSGRAGFLQRPHQLAVACFTIEYASWFRVILPGLERLGFVIPLGGTTLFFRRKALEEIGGWDAHNVTEDADLGIRLARRGYRTELLPTRSKTLKPAKLKSPR